MTENVHVNVSAIIHIKPWSLNYKLKFIFFVSLFRLSSIKENLSTCIQKILLLRHGVCGMKGQKVQSVLEGICQITRKSSCVNLQ
jgi:hypothetical protein